MINRRRVQRIRRLFGITKNEAVALSPTKKTNRSLPKGIERFAAFVYNKIAKNHQQESEDIIPQ